MKIIVDMDIFQGIVDGLFVKADANQLVYKFLRVFSGKKVAVESDVADSAFADVGNHLHGAAFGADFLVH